MSDQLTTSAPDAGPRRRPDLRTGLVQLVIAVVALAAVGALAGVVWEWVWTAPVGVVADHRWVAEDEAGLRAQFSGTGWYVVVAGVAGLVAGIVVGLVLTRVPLLTLVGVLLGSVLGAWLMMRVGVALGPPDPHTLARTAHDGTHLPAQLSVVRWSPYTSLPVGALVGLAVVFLALARRSHRHG